MNGAMAFEDAFLSIKPIQYSTGPNFWTAESDGWGISAPTVRELVERLRHWCAIEPCTPAGCGWCGYECPAYANGRP